MVAIIRPRRADTMTRSLLSQRLLCTASHAHDPLFPVASSLFGGSWSQPSIAQGWT
jgi:hypothetical protein